MRNHSTISLVIFLIYASISSAQVNHSILALKNNDIKKAKYLIDSLAEVQAFDNDAELWYVDGLVYESIYFSKDSAIKTLSRTPLLIAGEAYLKASKCQQNKRYNAMATKRLDSAITKNLLVEGEKLENEKKIEDAVNHLELYNKLKSNDTTGLLRLGIAAEKAKNFELAKEAYTKLLALKYNIPLVYKSLFMILKDNKNYAEAQKILMQGQKLYPNDEDWIKMDISLQLDMKNYNVAIKKIDTASVKYPENKKLYLYNKGAIYDAIDSTTLAVEYYQKALEIDNNYFEPNYNLGGIYYEKARADYEKINKMAYADYQKQGKLIEDEGHLYSKQALPYFEKCYAIKKDIQVKLLLKDVYRNLKMNAKLRDLE